MFFIFIIVIVIILIIAFGKTPVTIKSHWQHFYDNITFSAGDFYAQVEEGLKERKIKGISITTESFLERHIFSAKRVYLRITENEYVFYICAAPFGTGTFISWWLCVKDEKIANKIPLLSKLVGKDRNNKTFYQMDTEAMYTSAISTVVASVADNMTAEKGFRLSELDRQYKELAK